MDLIIIPKGAGKYDVTDSKERMIYTVIKKKRIIGGPITTLFDPSGYRLYSVMRTESGSKPAFQIIFNDAVFMAAKCHSMFVDPRITFDGGSHSFELKGTDSREMTLYSRNDPIGEMKTEKQANGEPKYLLTVDNKHFDDFIPLFAVIADKCFNGSNK